MAVPAALTVYGLSFLNGMGTVSLDQPRRRGGVDAGLPGRVVRRHPVGLRAGPTRRPRPWSVRSLAVAFAAAAVLTVITMSNLDVAVKGQLAAVRVEAGARALALAPPRLGRRPRTRRRSTAGRSPPSPRRTSCPPCCGTGRRRGRPTTATAFDPADREQQEFLESQQRGLALLREAAAMPQCSFDRDWSSDTSPVDMPVPELPAPAARAPPCSPTTPWPGRPAATPRARWTTWPPSSASPGTSTTRC